MKEYHFYYDETSHSRKISYKSIEAINYYDSFLTAIVGWSVKDEEKISERYLDFENKYEFRKNKDRELKSQTLKESDFRYGFRSLRKDNVEFVKDFLDLFDEDIYLYFSTNSKMEYLVNQLFINYKSSLLIDVDYIKYSIVKSLVLYHPENVIHDIYESSDKFLEDLKEFFEERIKYNENNLALKSSENKSFCDILTVLNSIGNLPNIDWIYDDSFIGFKKFLQDYFINSFTLTIDKEGEQNKDSNTLIAAKHVGFIDATEGDSKDYFGLRIADMIVGISFKIMKNIAKSLQYKTPEEGIRKHCLEQDWFILSQDQLDLYHKMYKIFCETQKSWNKIHLGIYVDDMIVFISLLKFFNKYKTIEELNKLGIDNLPEIFNTFSCMELRKYFYILHNKLLKNVSMVDMSKDYYFDDYGAKHFYDYRKHKLLMFKGKQKIYHVLSAGFDSKGTAAMTVIEEGEAHCYRLPQYLTDWAMDLVALSNEGNNLLPCDVMITKVENTYKVNLLKD